MLREKSEVQTIVLILLCYGLWAVLLFAPLPVPEWLTGLILIPLFTLHSSLQHECIHGHPFLKSRFNDLLAYPPLGLFLPYGRYKEMHLAHHQRASISDPVQDPESWYLTQAKWDRLNPLLRALLRFNNTLIGRMVLGPIIGIGSMIINDSKSVQAGSRYILRHWLIHGILVGFALVFIGAFGSVSVLTYCVCAYVGMSILMIRTYLEHQAHETLRGRTVIIEDKGPLRLLFLNNNLHAVHHAYPTVAWYRLPVLFRQNRERFLQMNTEYYYRSYWDIIRQYIFSAKEPVIYPLPPKSQ